MDILNLTIRRLTELKQSAAESQGLTDKAIEKLADRLIIFSAWDVAAYADLQGAEDSIKNALRAHHANRTIMRVGGKQNSAIGCLYLGVHAAEKWWVDFTIRLAELGVDYLTTTQLAGSMSLVFNSLSQEVPSPSLLAVGQRWSMVTDGYKPDTFVFPWAAILHTNPQLQYWFRLVFTDKILYSQLEESSFDIAVDKALSFLTEREAIIIRERFGIGTGYPSTLEEIGKRQNLTRERIRQIETKVLKKLCHYSRIRNLWLGFVADFFGSNRSLLIARSLTPQFRLFITCTNLEVIPIPELALHIIGVDANLVRKCRTVLHYAVAGLPCRPIVQEMPFLPRSDAVRINTAENRYLEMQVMKSRANMLHNALLSLGRAAHYREIAERCNQLFPSKKRPVRNWHTALSYCAHPDREDYGIVWIGAKGMYGLREHGYSRPAYSLFQAVAKIVEDKFVETQLPVSEKIVAIELKKYREKFNLNSVKMALSFNDKLEAVDGGYIPKAADFSTPTHEFD